MISRFLSPYPIVFVVVLILEQGTSYSKKSGMSQDLGKLYDMKPFPSNIDQLNNYKEDVLPQLDKSQSGNVTAVLDKTAILNCRVKFIGNKTVSWLRHFDTHLLTIGRYTYTSDLRFKAIHKVHSEDYLLHIKPVLMRDAGLYECQISTTPIISHYVFLDVTEPETEILGGPEIYIEGGSTLNLTCVIRGSPEPPSYVFWRQGDKIVSYDSERGGVTVITEKGDNTASYLLIQNARPQDSGIYSCSPSTGNPRQVNVHVIKGEQTEQLKVTSAGIDIVEPILPKLLLLSTILNLFSHQLCH